MNNILELLTELEAIGTELAVYERLGGVDQAQLDAARRRYHVMCADALPRLYRRLLVSLVIERVH